MRYGVRPKTETKTEPQTSRQTIIETAPETIEETVPIATSASPAPEGKALRAPLPPPGPGETILARDTEAPLRRTRRRLGSDDSNEALDEPQAAPRPPSGFPRQIEHQEQVEYSYDPMTDTYDVQLVASSEPVVTEWDKSSPSRDEREVGTWDVTPADDGVIVQNRERVTIPDAVKARLKQAADERGEAVRETSTLHFNHDLDTRETEHHARRSTAELAAALMARKQRDSTQDDALGERFQKLAERFQRQQLQTRAAAKNRRSSRSKKKEGGYKLPTIVITQEAGDSTRRVGGL